MVNALVVYTLFEILYLAMIFVAANLCTCFAMREDRPERSNVFLNILGMMMVITIAEPLINRYVRNPIIHSIQQSESVEK